MFIALFRTLIILSFLLISACFDDNSSGQTSNEQVIEPQTLKPQDSDGDGVADIEDDFPQDASRDSDTDGDGIADIVYILDPTGNRTNQIDEALSDSDDDGDGVSDADDRFPLNRVESEDTDNDGVGNNADLDDDNDGYNDLVDAFPLDNLEFRDSDLDGIGNRFDADDDNDGILDEDDDSLTSIVANDSYSRVIVDSTRNQIYFTFKEKKTVSVFDSRTLVEISSIRFPEMPESIAFSRDHNSLYIALLEHEHLSSRQIEDQKGYIAEIDLTSLEVKRRFHVNIDPLNLAITTSGKIIVASGSGGRKNVHVYSLSDGSFVDSLENPFSDMSQYTMDSNGEAFYVLTMNNVIKYKITDDKISYAGSLFQKNHANSADIYYSAKHNYVITQDGRVFQTSDNPKKALALIIDLTKDSSDSILSLTFDDVNNLVIVQTDARIDYYQAVTFELIRSESQSGLRNIFTDGVSLFGFSVHSQLSSDQTVLTELAHRCPRCASNTAPKVKVNIEPTGMLTPESQVSFNLGESTDEQDSLSELLISWDIDADGTWDVDYTSDKTFTKQYPYAGTKYLRVKMKDSDGLVTIKRVSLDISQIEENDDIFKLPYPVTDLLADSTRDQYYYTSKAMKRLFAVNSQTGLVENEFSFEHHPEKITLSPDGNKLYVSLMEDLQHPQNRPLDELHGFIVEIDLENFTALRQFVVNVDPKDIVVSTDGRLFVSSHDAGEGRLSVYNLLDGSHAAQADIPGYSTLVLHPSENILYTNSIWGPQTSGMVHKFHINNRNFVDGSYITINVDPYDANNIFITPDGAQLFDSNGWRYTIDPNTGEISTGTHFQTHLNIRNVSYDLTNGVIVTSEWYNGTVGVYNLNTFEKIGDLFKEDGGKFAHEYKGSIRTVFSNSEGSFVKSVPHLCLDCLNNTPPTVRFTVTPEIGGTVNTQYVFDASLSSDLETANEDLKYAWDFDGDGLFWRASTTNKQVRTFDSHGQKKIFLKVIDSGGMADIAEINIEIAP